MSDIKSRAGEIGVTDLRGAHLDGAPAALSALVSEFASSPAGVVIVDAEGLIIATSPSLVHMFGFHGDELVGRTLDTLLPRDLVSKGNARHADGQLFPVEIGLSPVDLAGGSGLFVVIADRSDERERDDLFDASPQGLAVVAFDGTIVRVNAAFVGNFGYEADELVGRSIHRLVARRHGRDLTDHLLACAAQSGVRPIAAARGLSVLCADGTDVPVEIRLSPVKVNRTPRVLLTFTDLSDRDRLERELRDAQSEVAQFTYVASHDLKSPLRGIKDLLEWVAEELEEPPEGVTKNLDRIALRVERMDQLIDDLLAYALAGRAGVMSTRIDMAAIVARVVEFLDVPPQFVIDTDVVVPVFLGPATPLETIIRNVVSNAVKHHDRADGHVLIRARADGPMVQIEVVDDGPGIPAMAHNRIFRMAHTASNHAEVSSGIGLAVCKRLAKNHGGTIDVQSEPGNGSIFTVRWPLPDEAGVDAVGEPFGEML